MSIWGVYNETTSINDSKKIVLSEKVPLGNQIRMKVDMLSGSILKIISLMSSRYWSLHKGTPFSLHCLKYCSQCDRC